MSDNSAPTHPNNSWNGWNNNARRTLNGGERERKSARFLGNRLAPVAARQGSRSPPLPRCLWFSYLNLRLTNAFSKYDDSPRATCSIRLDERAFIRALRNCCEIFGEKTLETNLRLGAFSKRKSNSPTLTLNERIPMKLTQTARMLLASLMFALLAIARTSQAGPTPTPSPAPTPSATPDDINLLPTPTPFPSPASSPSPVPKLYLRTQEHYSTGGKNWVRYSYDVLNKTDYPAALFAPAPNLPPCGLNHNSSRTWVDFFDQHGTRLYGFCALSKPDDLGSIWFALEEGVIPPSWVYIEINDRQTNTKYRSNLADTTL